MALLDILVYPDSRLRRQATPVEQLDATIQELVDDMAETMYAAPGIGLAAVQVNVAKQVIVIDTSETRDNLRVFINPTLIESDGDVETEEGCLSVPGVYAPVHRAEKITVRALDREGESFELEVDGLLAVCIQHEMDHLQGKVFVDYLSRMKQDRIRKRMIKEQKASPHPVRQTAAAVM